MHYGILALDFGRSGQNAPEMLMLIESLGGDIEQLWYEHKFTNHNEQFQGPSQHQIEGLMKSIDLVLRHSGDGWLVLCHLTFYVFYPTRENFFRLQTMLQDGLSPNMGILFSDHENLLPIPLLCEAMYRAAEQLRLGHEEDTGSAISLLVEYGANIHYIFPETLENASSWQDLKTLWNLALGQEFETGWLNALHDAGVDVDGYRWEEMRRRKQAIRLRGATRSGVDEQVLELPSISGLRCRKCRKYCEKHNHGILEDREWDEYEDRQREKRERKAV
jgi:hypothetical protein